MMPIKTYDGVDLISKHMRLNAYPEGSISPREVILTLPPTGNDVEQAFKVNSTISHALYKKAEEFIKANPPQKPLVKFTPVADLKYKIDDPKKRAEELTSAVITALTVSDKP